MTDQTLEARASAWCDGVRSGYQSFDGVAVYGPWGCGHCRTCATRAEQNCEVAAERGIVPPGPGAPGWMAEFMLVDDARHLVPLRGLDPVQAAPLTDAGLTPYHAIKPSLPRLVPGSTAVVIGVSVLGHLAIRMLRALSSCQVIALDLLFSMPFEVSVLAPYWAPSRVHEVLAPARSGALTVETETFSLDDAATIHERMHARTLRGRAVVTP